MATAPKFRIDVDIHNLLMNSSTGQAITMRVIKFVWTQLVKNHMKGGAQSFDH